MVQHCVPEGLTVWNVLKFFPFIGVKSYGCFVVLTCICCERGIGK